MSVSLLPRTALTNRKVLYRFRSTLLILVFLFSSFGNGQRPTNAPFIRGPIIFIETSAVVPTTKTPSARPSLEPTQTPDPTGAPTKSPRPTISPQPSLSMVPSRNPTTLPTLRPTVSTSPSRPPTILPSGRPTPASSNPPTLSLQPSEIPTKSPKPSQSSFPSWNPSTHPSDIPTPTPTRAPTAAPSISRHPSEQPSVHPSAEPTSSSVPSHEPSISMEPTGSVAPSWTPSARPSHSPLPSNIPSTIPTTVPSSNPSTPFPTLFPTPSLRLVRQPFLSMRLWGIDRDVRDFERTSWAAITSRHVQLYWRNFDRDSAYFYVGRVTTTLIREERGGSQRRLQSGNVTRPLTIVYSQEIECVAMAVWKDCISHAVDFRYDLRPNVSSDDIPSFLMEEQLFTLPFEQDGLSYTNALRTELRNNTNPIFLEYIGIIDPPNQMSINRNRRILITIIVVVLTAVFVAGGVIVYLTRFRESEDSFAHNDSPVGATIGVKNILLSEDYSTDYRSPTSAGMFTETKRGSPGDRSTPSGSDPPVREVRGDASSPNVATTISDIGSAAGDAADRHKSGQSTGSIHSINQSAGEVNSPLGELSPTREQIEDYFEDSTTGTNDADSRADQSTSLPNMANFEMEIKDLE